MIGDKAAKLVEHRMQGCNIAVARKKFGMLPNAPVIQPIQKTLCSISSTDTQNSVYRGIQKGSIYVPGTKGIIPCQITVPGPAAFIHDRFQPQRTDSFCRREKFILRNRA